MRRKILQAGLGLVGAWLLGACSKKSEPVGADAGTQRLRIAMIPKGTTHEFWKSVHAGGVKAARELDIDLVWKGPLKEDDLKSQVDLMDTFVAQRVSAILLAPLNDKALVAPVNRASAGKIPVVIFDSGLSGGNFVSFVATDNRAAGRLGGDHLAKLLEGDAAKSPKGEKGKVVVLRYQEGSASTNEREEGALEALRKNPGIEIVSDNQYGGATTESAFSASESILLAKKAAQGGVTGIFTPNESTTFGMLLALEKAKLAGKIRFVGFDASDKLVEAVRAGSVDGLVLQDPFRMGYLAVRAAVDHVRGQTVATRTDTGAKLVHRENLGQPEIQALIKPDLAKWLGN
jgi:ribose transport system substrate-binding protein